MSSPHRTFESSSFHYEVYVIEQGNSIVKTHRYSAKKQEFVIEKEVFQDFRALFLRETDSGEKLLRATELRGPMEINARSVRKKASELSEEDRVALKVPTPHRPQDVVFQTQSGALQVSLSLHTKR